jgi:WD40 repeat protein
MRQRSGEVGQRFESLDRLARAARELRDDPEGRSRLAELRDHAIAAMGLTDLRLRWQRKIGSVMSIAVDRQLERYAVVELQSGQTIVRRADDDRELLRVPRPEVSFWHPELDFSPDGQYLLVNYYVSGSSGLMDVWHIQRRERVVHESTRFEAHVFHPNGRRLVFAPPGKDLVVWDLVARRELKRLPLDFKPYSLCLDPTGTRVAANATELADSTVPGQVEILDLETGQNLASWKGQVGHHGMSWSGDGRLIATGHEDGRVFVWDVERGRLASVLQGHTSRILGILGCDFAPASHLLVTSSWDATKRLWDAATGEPLVRVPEAEPRGFSAAGRRLASYGSGMLYAWDVTHGQEVRTLNPGLFGNRTESPMEDGVHAADFSPDNTLAALATRGGTYLYDARSGQELARIDTGSCATVLFDPQGRSVIIDSDRGLFRCPIRPETTGGVALRVGPPDPLQETTSGGSNFESRMLASGPSNASDNR